EALSGAAAASTSGGADWGASDRQWDSWSGEAETEEPEEEEEEEEPEEEEEEEFAGDEAIFPIADYDELKAAEVVSLLPELDDDELDQVRDREARGGNRATVIKRIDQLLGVEEPPPARRAPAKKQAKKAQPKKAAAKKTAAKKTAAKSTRKSTG